MRLISMQLDRRQRPLLLAPVYTHTSLFLSSFLVRIMPRRTKHDGLKTSRLTRMLHVRLFYNCQRSKKARMNTPYYVCSAAVQSVVSNLARLSVSQSVSRRVHSSFSRLQSCQVKAKQPGSPFFH